MSDKTHPRRSTPIDDAPAAPHVAKPIFEQGTPGRSAARRCHRSTCPTVDAARACFGSDRAQRRWRRVLPEVSEVEVTRHYTRLSRWNYAIDIGLYPLGSCTMKYNPKVNERAARMPGFAGLHPACSPSPPSHGALELMWGLEKRAHARSAASLASLCSPSAGAQGELCWRHDDPRLPRGQGASRPSKVLIPDSAHGTNPASCAAQCASRRWGSRPAPTGCFDVETVKEAMRRPSRTTSPPS